jgi:CRP/FNR family cyclic AMP-dependent transcriptional regulator
MLSEDDLGRIPLFAQFRREDLTRLAKTLVSRKFSRGAVVVEEGKRAVGFFVIVKGSVEVVQGLGDSQERQLATLQAGDFFGELSLLDGYPCSASVRALEDSECLVLSRSDFLAELRQSPQMAVSMLPVLSARVRQAEKAVF